ncbi:hypothetical protein GCM10009682_06050 [Luedemannella flava]|uniref:NTP pyrophosphohydrolase MazG putative catalytic core domain-containing protein n=1 Tax=Luedemannella flava TaxID=349316 RepID=A0ABN2LF81_9ACTN
MTEQMSGTDDLWARVRAAVAWFDATNGRDQAEITLRILKIVEEAGEAAGAWIGALGQNPRKGHSHTVDDVAAELADVAFATMVAIASLGVDVEATITACARKVSQRIDDEPGE